MLSRALKRTTFTVLFGFLSLLLPSLHLAARAQCGGTGTPPPGCPGAAYRAASYDDLGTDYPDIWDGYDATTSPEAVLQSAVPYTYNATMNAALAYMYQGGGYYDVYSLVGDCTWSNFSSITTSAATTLHIPYSVTNYGFTGAAEGTPYVTVSITIGTTTSTVHSGFVANGSGTWTYTVPSGTDLSTVSVHVRLEPPGYYDNYDWQYAGTSQISLDVYIQ